MKILKIFTFFVLFCFSANVQARTKPITYSGKNTFKTDHLVFLSLNQSGDMATLSYVDTGPSMTMPISQGKNAKVHKINAKAIALKGTISGISTRGTPHWNTNDEKESHILTEVVLPKGFTVDPDSLTGKSYGKGCQNISFFGTTYSVALCDEAYLQTVTVEWQFTAYPKNWKKKK